jgi:co-chaperonin GroES (HSP10)
MIKLNQKQIKAIKPGVGKVLVAPSRMVDEINVGDKKIYFDPSFNFYEHAPVTGTVIAFNSTPHWNPNHYLSVPTIEVGDEIVYSYHEGAKILDPKFDETIVCTDTQQIYLFVQYSECYAKIEAATKQVKGLNHYHICSPIARNVEVGIELPDHLKKRNSASICKVEFSTCIETRYRKEVSPGQKVEAGHYIVFDRNADIPLEYEIHRSVMGRSELFAIAQRDIVAVVDNPELVRS